MHSKITNLILAGGGNKGVVYGGMLKALETANVLTQLEKISGSSAGAITAAFIATGISSEDLAKDVFSQDLSGKVGSGLFGWFNDGKPLVEFINDILIQTINKNIVDIDLSKRNDLTEEDKTKFKSLQNNIIQCNQASQTKDKYKITFGDLSLLRKIKPEKFKHLYVTAVSKRDNKLEIFSTTNESYQNISITEACRASSALPLLFKAAEINGEYFIDGGVKSNIPVEALLEGESEIKGQENQEKIFPIAFLEQTLVCSLDEGGRNIDKNPTYKSLHSKTDKVWEPTTIEKIIMAIMRALGLFPPSYIKDANDEYQGIAKDFGLNVLNLDVEGLTVTDFRSAMAKGDENHLQGYLSTVEYLINHEKLGQLNDTEYKQLVDRTRLQECFLKIITGAKLDRNSQLYKDLIAFCKDEKFQDCSPGELKAVRPPSENTEYQDALKAHQKWMEENQEYKAWEKAKEKEEYNKSQEAITEYNKEFQNVDYLKDIVEAFAQTINKSDELSSAKARIKLHPSLEKVMKDPYISSNNIKDLFGDVSFVDVKRAKDTDALPIKRADSHQEFVENSQNQDYKKQNQDYKKQNTI